MITVALTKFPLVQNLGCIASIARTPLRISLRLQGSIIFPNRGFGDLQSIVEVCVCQGRLIFGFFLSSVIRLFYQYRPNYNIFSNYVSSLGRSKLNGVSRFIPDSVAGQLR
ncbi:hypothetical protein PILCRDRAFT_616251 [Piloderma croceum F 1598]|uniref:Uncharacterized protein n=1 Tax=Piloderma croceum (strain F 1598) TaxID=765440 RepID=A0A0C3EY82_PILCF|nr:hypothetical protein PILCRDRAFT_616251 [Piloderma croceum F 1598]